MDVHLGFRCHDFPAKKAAFIIDLMVERSDILIHYSMFIKNHFMPWGAKVKSIGGGSRPPPNGIPCEYYCGIGARIASAMRASSSSGSIKPASRAARADAVTLST